MFRRRGLRRRLESAGAVPSALDDAALTALTRAADAGAGSGGCVRAAPCVRLAALRLWRWPQLSDEAELRRLPACADTGCCNPWHWSCLCKPETPLPAAAAPAPPREPAPPRAPPREPAPPLPPHSRVTMHNITKAEDHEERSEDARRTDHERPPGAGAGGDSLTTDGEERMWWESEWCRLAYWELTRRVGRQYGVRPRAVDVFGGGEAAAGPRTGLCLDALRSPPPGAPPAEGAPPEQVRRARAKIGLGVTLSLEADGVWLYNRSEEPVFVSSPALDAAAARALLVWRVAPGHCLCVFDPRAPPSPPPARAPLGPVDPRSVRISFAKGWGPKYSRRDVTACPCWLEVLLAPQPAPAAHS